MHRKYVDNVRRLGFTDGAVEEAWHALAKGGGGMAQFAHTEFGGPGQWMPGLIMIGDPFNTTLKHRVDSLFTELSAVMRRQVPECSTEPGWSNAETRLSSRANVSFSYQREGGWYPADLGAPTSIGAQNGLRYAYFAAHRRLAIELAGVLRIYDTLDHAITGIHQNQDGGGGEIAFSGQRGIIKLSSLLELKAKQRG